MKRKPGRFLSSVGLAGLRRHAVGPTDHGDRLWGAAGFLLFLIVAACALWVSPDAAWMNPVSDAVDYAVSGHRLATLGTLDIVVNGGVHPSRFPPGFSALFLAPVYWIDDSHYGLGIIAVFVSALATLVCVWILCRNLLGGWAGAAAAFYSLAMLLEVAYFRLGTQRIMSDLSALLLLACGVCLLQRAWQAPRVVDFLLAGLLTAVAGSVRITALSLCLPFVYLIVRVPAARRWRAAAALAGPIVAGVAILLFYNFRTFGDPLFTGYHYWYNPEAYRLEPSRFLRNLATLSNPLGGVPGETDPLHPAVALIAGSVIVLLGALCRTRRPDLWERSAPLLASLVLSALPIFVFHLFYNFASSRFALFLYLLMIVLGTIWFFGLTSALPRGYVALLGVLAIWNALDARIPAAERQGLSSLEVMEAASELLPDDSYFVSELTPVFVDVMLIEGTQRTHVPANRRVGFVGWEDIGFPGEEPVEVFEFNAADEPERIEELLRAGERVFVNIRIESKLARAWGRFLARFSQRKVWQVHTPGPSIVELSLPIDRRSRVDPPPRSGSDPKAP